MSAKSAKWKKENAFYLSDKGRIALNKRCLNCVNDCKQSRKALLVVCPIYIKKE